MILFMLFLAANLSDYMPPDVQQRTGITSLTRRQQNELADWLSRYMEPTASKNPNKPQLTIAENYHGGFVLQLSDGSIWEVAPKDTSYSGLWLTPFPVAIGESSDPIYPYTITDLATGTTVRVRRIYTINPPGLPKQPPSYGKSESTSPSQPQQSQKPAKTPKQSKQEKTPSNAKGPGFTETNPGSTTVEPNQDQLPGTTPGPGQGGPS